MKAKEDKLSGFTGDAVFFLFLLNTLCKREDMWWKTLSKIPRSFAAVERKCVSGATAPGKERGRKEEEGERIVHVSLMQPLLGVRGGGKKGMEGK